MRIPGLAFSGALLLATWLGARPAVACGITAGGAVGLTSCSLEEHEEAVRRKWHLGSSYAFSSTGLRFEGERQFVQERHASLVTLEFRPVRRGTLLAGAGAFLGGHLRTEDDRFDFAPGFVGVVGASWRLIEAGRSGPFVLLTAQLSYALTECQGAAYNAIDLRGGAIAATTIWRFLTPYLLARAFAGPVYWRYQGQSVAGTDTHHYQLGGGLAMLVKGRVNLFAEGVPVGERGLVAGAGLSF